MGMDGKPVSLMLPVEGLFLPIYRKVNLLCICWCKIGIKIDFLKFALHMQKMLFENMYLFFNRFLKRKVYTIRRFYFSMDV